jgi:hypothetical protein
MHRFFTDHPYLIAYASAPVGLGLTIAIVIFVRKLIRALADLSMRGDLD